MNRVSSIARPALVAAVTLGASLVGAEARIESFSPSGYTKDASQVAVRFSEAMVALGDPDRPDPFAVRCAVAGTGRWIDERNWVYDFDYDLPGAEACRFTLRRGVRTLAGERLVGQREHRFHTGGPSILRHAPNATIDERQVFLLALDADADPESIREHVGCRVEGRRDIGVALVAGDTRTEDLGPPDARAMLFVEFDYADANGQIATASGYFELWPAALRLEIEPVAEAPSGVRTLRIVAIGVDGKPLGGKEVEASLYSHLEQRRQMRLPGGFRAWSYLRNQRHEADCSGRTDANGILECQIPPHVDGMVEVEAVAHDEDGNAAKAQRRIWPDSNFLETDEYKLHLPGEYASVAVASPFAKATALVSVHGEGVLDAFVTELDGPQAVVEIPIRRSYADGVNVSVLAVRGREPGTKPAWLDPTGQVFAEGGRPGVHGDLSSYDPLSRAACRTAAEGPRRGPLRRHVLGAKRHRVRANRGRRRRSRGTGEASDASR